MEQVAHYSEIEKYKGYDQRKDGADGDNLHGQVALGTNRIGSLRIFTLQLFAGKAYSTLNDGPRFDDTNNPGGGNTPDTDMARIGSKDLFGTHTAYRGSDGCVAKGKNLRTEQGRQQRDNHQPHQK